MSRDKQCLPLCCLIPNLVTDHSLSKTTLLNLLLGKKKSGSTCTTKHLKNLVMPGVMKCDSGGQFQLAGSMPRESGHLGLE